MDAEAQDNERVKKAVEALGEYFDTVQIFVTRKDHDGTFDGISGSGNYYARYGHVKHWLLKEEEVTRTGARKLDEE